MITATFDRIENLVRSYNPDADFDLLRRAYDFASELHSGQKRKSGEAFLNHPVEVALILAELHMDTSTLAAALLHDVVEDSGVSLRKVKKEFGEEIAGLVDGVTKLGKIKFESLAEQQSQNLRKMLVAMAKDIRVILIKLADRLHNMRTLSALDPQKRREKAIETLEIYAPLAHRLGISSIKWELEDLAFYYLEPRVYHQIQRMVAEKREDRERYLGLVSEQLERELAAAGIRQVEIMGRPKHLYSIYQKMTHKGKDFSEIYDLIAIRVIVPSVKDCYGALGVVHAIWKPVPGRFKDYVAMPKFNMYQSLHTTVVGPEGRTIEIQIRTEEMHRTAEYGVAAHWKYKEGTKREESFGERLAWLRQMLEWQTELKDPREFMEALKIDLFEDEVFVFTPKGDVISLRRGSTPIDFAYAIHTEVGNHTVGAKVNGSIVPLTYELRNGDRVEILTSKNAHPSRDWMSIVRTSKARSKIRAYLSKESREDDVQKGKEDLAKILRKQGITYGAQESAKALQAVAEDMNYAKAEDLLAGVGAGKVSAKQVATKLIKRMAAEGAPAEAGRVDVVPEGAPLVPPRHKRRSSPTGVKVKGLDDVLVRMARCCNPVPGDEIIGFVTRGRGVSVHRVDCPNAEELLKEPERLIDVAWDSDTAATYHVEIRVEAVDRPKLLYEISTVLAEAGVNILSASVNRDKQGISNLRFLFELGNMEQLSQILTRIRDIDDVFTAERAMPYNAGSGSAQ
ncbi:MAG: bifunctional (p)ppGpp synthetase/guanosine-3',5'-bis(diphosphate) 3'-pyrophosphohydrolase [Coriobacteriia bacterium]